MAPVLKKAVVEAAAVAAEAAGLARLKLMVDALLRRAALLEREWRIRGVQSG